MDVAEIMTWETLVTYGGAVCAVSLVTQLTKRLKFIRELPTQIWSYILALVGLVSTTLFMHGLDMYHSTLCVFNAMLVSIGANGGYNLVKKLQGHTEDGVLVIDPLSQQSRLDLGIDFDALIRKKR